MGSANCIMKTDSYQYNVHVLKAIMEIAVNIVAKAI